MLGDPNEEAWYVGRAVAVDNVEEAESSVDERGGGEETMIEAEIIVLDDTISDDKDTPADERLVRRQLRTLKRLEDTAADREVPTKEALDEHCASKRKQKGKQVAGPTPKKPRLTRASLRVQEAAPATILVPFYQLSDPEVSWSDDEDDVELENPQDEEGAFEKIEVRVTKKLLYEMTKFEDPKQSAACAGGESNGKMAKTGRKLCLEDLKDLGVDKKFTNYLEQIGFQWLLNDCTEEVPVTLAREFFTTFTLKSTADPDADSISFRVFNQEYILSIGEWSLRLGLFTLEEDEKGAWNERAIGPPKKTKGFNADAAWRLVAHKRWGKFKTSCSKGAYIADPVLRLAQVYIGYNLLGQIGATLTTPELYFMWCMLNGVKVHLGYWIAHACHLVRTHPDRHLFTCNLLGAFLKRNIVMKIVDSVTNLPMCDASVSFDLPFLFNKGLVVLKDVEVQFYEGGGQEVVAVQSRQEEEASTAKETKGDWRKRMEAMMVTLGEAAESQRKIS